MKSILILFDNVVSLYIWVLIINAIMSWLVAFNVINTGNRFVYSVLDISYKLNTSIDNLFQIIKMLEKNKLISDISK